METDQGDKGDACLLRSSPSMPTDHNMKMQPMSTFSPLTSLSIWPFILFLPLTFSSWSLHLTRPSPVSLSLSLSFSIGWSRNETDSRKLTVEEVSDCLMVKKKEERWSSKHFSVLSPLLHMSPMEGRSVTDYIWSSQKLNWNSKQKYKRALYAIGNRDFLSVILLTWESDKSACLQQWPEDECCYLGFSHTVHLSQSPAHSTIRLTSALHISSTLPVPTLIPPPLPQIQHNQCFIWPWLNPFCFHLLEKAWVAILRGAHPINLSCQSWDFSTDA